MTADSHDKTHLFGLSRLYRKPTAEERLNGDLDTAFRGSKVSYVNLFNVYGTFSDKNNQSRILLLCCPYL